MLYLLLLLWAGDIDCTLEMDAYLAYWRTPGLPEFDPNGDGSCDIRDLVFFANTCADGRLRLGVVPDQRAAGGDVYQFAPRANREGLVWFKEYGPDAVSVNRQSGLLTWSIPAELPRESFHLGVKAVDPQTGEAAVETWILTVGNQAVLYVGPNETYTTLRQGVAAMNGGDTVIVRNGTYLADHIWGGGEWGLHGGEGVLPPSGSADAFTTVMAEDPGQVVFDGQGWSYSFLRFSGVDRRYLAFKGMETHNYVSVAITIDNVQWIKLIDVGVVDSGRAAWADDGAQNVVNISLNRAQNILIEGAYVWGYSRYQIAPYHCQNVVVRRSVARLEAFHGTDPVGVFQFYCCNQVHGQNLIAVDGDQHQFWTRTGYVAACFAMAATNCQDNPPTNSFQRCIALNNSRPLLDNYAQDSPMPGVWRDIVGWDFFTDRFFSGTGGFVPLLALRGAGELRGLTVGEVRVDAPGFTDGQAFFNLPYQATTLANSLFHRLGVDQNQVQTRGPLISEWSGVGSVSFDHVWISDFQDTWVQAGQSNRVTVSNVREDDPTGHGLMYLPRVEAGSVLAAAGDDGGPVGANVMTFIGRSGTFYGEPGWDEETEISMWPFPHEDLIKRRFATYSYSGPTRSGNTQTINGRRGFCAEGVGLTGKAITLTSYIWEYLGNACPPEICDYGY